MKLAGVQVACAPAIPRTKLRRTSRPRGVCDDLRVELDPVQVPRRVDQAGERRRVGLGRRPEAVRQARDRVAVAHPDRLVAIEPGEQSVVRGERHGRRTVLALRRRDHVPAELMGHQVGAVADPEDGDPAAPDHRVGPRRVHVVDGARAARQDDRLRTTALDVRPWRVVGQELGVDVELTDPPCDELGELAAEVEDEDRVRAGRRLDPRPVVARAIRGRRVERGLEVGLDLGVVRCEHAMAGVGRLAVDGLAAARLRRRFVEVGRRDRLWRPVRDRLLSRGRPARRCRRTRPVDGLRVAQSPLPSPCDLQSTRGRARGPARPVAIGRPRSTWRGESSVIATRGRGSPATSSACPPSRRWR